VHSSASYPQNELKWHLGNSPRAKSGLSGTAALRYSFRAKRGTEMRGHVTALEDRNPVDQLACLILRVLQELAPCTERSLIDQVSGGDPRSQPGQASHAHTRELVHSALQKLKALACIEAFEERIAITDEGRRCLKESAVVTLRQRGRSAEARESKADHRVATDYCKQDAVTSTTRAKTHPCVSSISQLPARRWTRSTLRVLATTKQSESAVRLKRFCLDRLTQVGRAMPPVCKVTVARAWDTSLCLWRHKVAPMIRSGATTLGHGLVQLAKVPSRAWKPMPLYEGTGEVKIGARLLKVAGANRQLLKLASLDVSRSINYAGVLVVVCGALSIAGGVVFLSSEGANSSSAEEANKGAGSSRASPIVWLHEGQHRQGRSIFVTRRLAGATWIEGLAIGGENASNQTLTGLQGVIKTESGEEIKLAVNTEGSQGKWADAQDVPAGSKFLLKAAVNPDSTQAGMPAQELLSKYGGMIFRVSYTVAGVETTLIEYFSTSRLSARLANLN
jgi:hypothetical protein